MKTPPQPAQSRAPEVPAFICEICGKPVPDYEPVGCCSGHECGCMGQPIEPCLCSKECDAAMFDINGTFEERRIRHGIELWKP